VIEILLSTYNGGKFLSAQLDSIINQTNQDWFLSIRDDGSSDRTLQIIEDYLIKFPSKINLLKDDGNRLGSTMSFASLIENSTGDYLMLCDQDDIWLNTKIEDTFNSLKSLEIVHPNKPLLVFTDLKEVDENLNVIAESFMQNQKLKPSVVRDTHKLLAINVVAGCTTMFNKNCKQFILPIPSKRIIHDQWIAVNIAQYGHVKFLNKPTIL
jgi:glycosyltransferase involved in cell wall biosynthesis